MTESRIHLAAFIKQSLGRLPRDVECYMLRSAVARFAKDLTAGVSRLVIAVIGHFQTVLASCECGACWRYRLGDRPYSLELAYTAF